MADTNDVLNRADSLMRPEGERAHGSSPLGETRRRRAFVAAPKEAPLRGAPVMPRLEEIDLAATTPADDEDLPVLTEIVAPEAAVAEAAPDRFDETLVSILAADLAHSIESRLAVELPSLIEATLDSFQQDLRRGIVAATDAALKDFLARRQQLRLPLDEPNLGD